MSLKGKIFTAEDLNPALRRRLASTPGALEAHLEAQTERYRVVAKAKDGTPYIAEELQERALRLLSPNVRVIATMMCMQLTEGERMELINAFGHQTSLIIPFDKA